MIENVSTQLTVFHCFAHCLLPGRAFASLYVLLFLEKEAEIGGRVISEMEYMFKLIWCCILAPILAPAANRDQMSSAVCRLLVLCKRICSQGS